MKQTALITGAAGGLGRAIACQLAHEGWRVYAGWNKTVAEPAPGLTPLPLDVTDAAAIAAAFALIRRATGGLDLLVNNAGLTADAPFWKIPEADWDRVINVCLKGAWRCCQAAVPLLEARHGGHIIQISSFAGRAGARGQAAYAAAKAGLLGLTQSLAAELAAKEIRVNAVLPGVLPTGMTSQLPPEQLAALAAANLLQRINTLDEVARFVAFLATTRNISGQVFQLDSRLARPF